MTRVYSYRKMISKSIPLSVRLGVALMTSRSTRTRPNNFTCWSLPIFCIFSAKGAFTRGRFIENSCYATFTRVSVTFAIYVRIWICVYSGTHESIWTLTYHEKLLCTHCTDYVKHFGILSVLQWVTIVNWNLTLNEQCMWELKSIK